MCPGETRYGKSVPAILHLSVLPTLAVLSTTAKTLLNFHVLDFPERKFYMDGNSPTLFRSLKG